MTPEEMSLLQLRAEALRLADRRAKEGATVDDIKADAEKLEGFLLKGIKVAVPE